MRTKTALRREKFIHIKEKFEKKNKTIKKGLKRVKKLLEETKNQLETNKTKKEKRLKALQDYNINPFDEIDIKEGYAKNCYKEWQENAKQEFENIQKVKDLENLIKFINQKLKNNQIPIEKLAKRIADIEHAMDMNGVYNYYTG